MWKSLEVTEKKIFSARLFFALAGLPNLEELDDDDMDNDLDETDKSNNRVKAVESLTAEEEAMYRPIYERLVDQGRVKAAFADGLEISSAPAVVKKGLQSAQRINSDVCPFC